METVDHFYNTKPNTRFRCNFVVCFIFLITSHSSERNSIQSNRNSQCSIFVLDPSLCVRIVIGVFDFVFRYQVYYLQPKNKIYLYWNRKMIYGHLLTFWLDVLQIITQTHPDTTAHCKLYMVCNDHCPNSPKALKYILSYSHTIHIFWLSLDICSCEQYG